MVYRVSTNNLYKTAMVNMDKMRNKLDNITKKTGAGNLYNSFGELGLSGNVRTVIDISSINQYYNTYTKNAAISKVKIDKALSSLNQIYDAALEVEKAMIGFVGDTSSYYNLEQLKNIAYAKLKEVNHSLNSEAMGSYVFSGSHVFVPPVKDLSMPNFSVDMSGNVNYSENALMTDYYQGDNVISNVILDDNLVLNYGVTANDPAFAKLIGSIHLALKTNEEDDLLDKAQNMIKSSMSDIAKLQQRMRHNYSIVERYQNFYEGLKLSMGEIQEEIDKENKVDLISLMTDYVENETILSSAQYMFSHMSKMSILDYLR